ncbi:MAG: hypothetical protein QOF51_2820 [Chloroflexota bacterium]|nr:hypothetical protein [Chloroflexota bacterium]
MSAIDVPFADADFRHLRISVGACRLRIGPDGGDHWATGVYEDPGGQAPLAIEQADGDVRIHQQWDVARVFGIASGPPTLSLSLGGARQYALTIETGASEAVLDLGGLPLTRLTLRLGATNTKIDFSAPNPTEMERLDLTVGAADTGVRNLANANAVSLLVEGGAAAYTLDFGGTLQRNLEARITAGMTSVELDVPLGTPARIYSETVLGSVDVGDGWMKQGGAFVNAAALADGTPILTVHANLALGQLRLRVS